MTTLELLAKLGLPSGVLAMVLLAVLFREGHSKVATVAAWTAVGLVSTFGVIQLVEALNSRDIIITTNPPGVQALGANGPVPLEIGVSRGGASLVSLRLEEPSKENYEQRLRNLGWMRGAECSVPDPTAPLYWSTHRVHAGQTVPVAQTKYGLLSIHARQYTGDGDAIVSLKLAGSDMPIPNEVAIKNKGLDVQSFSAIPVFFIAVREADFTPDPARVEAG